MVRRTVRKATPEDDSWIERVELLAVDPEHPDDYADWPIEVIDGVRWHVSPPDPEGVEGQQRVPCAEPRPIETAGARLSWDVQGGTR